MLILLNSGEKTSTKEWSTSLEIKGRVRLDAFEKFLQELPMSRTRALMVYQGLLLFSATKFCLLYRPLALGCLQLRQCGLQFSLFDSINLSLVLVLMYNRNSDRKFAKRLILVHMHNFASADKFLDFSWMIILPHIRRMYKRDTNLSQLPRHMPIMIDKG